MELTTDIYLWCCRTHVSHEKFSSWFVCLLLILISGHIISQQAIQYQIAAELNPEQKSLSVKTNITLSNFTLDPKDTIYFLIWENAIRNKNSYFHQRNLIQYNVNYYFDKNTELAGFHDLAISVNGQKSKWEYDKTSDEIIKIPIHQDYLNLDLTINFEYTLLMPKTACLDYLVFTAWYPVFAGSVKEKIQYKLLDPILYPEEIKADFSVKITSPKDWEIRSNGKRNQIQTEDKTITSFEALDQTDLTWVAQTKSAESISGHINSGAASIPYHIIACEVSKYNYKSLHQDIQKIFNYLNTNIGPYPYEEFMLVESSNIDPIDIRAGLNIFSQNFDSTRFKENIFEMICEVWLHGSFQVNTSIDSWIKKALVMYYHDSYQRMNTLKKNAKEGSVMTFEQNYEPSGIRSLFNELLLYQKKESIKKDPAKLSLFNECCGRQLTASIFLNYLEDYLAGNDFKLILKSFFTENKGKVVGFEDLVSHIGNKAGKDLSAIYHSYLIDENSLDYKIEKVIKSNDQLNIEVSNHTAIGLPYPIKVMLKSGKTQTFWQEGFTGSKNASIPLLFPIDSIKTISIDAIGLLPDFNRQNNHYHPNKVFPKAEPIKLGFVFSENNSFNTDLKWSPVLIHNDNNSFSPGFVFANTTGSPKLFKFAIMPAYSFSTKKWIGQAWFSKEHIIKSNVLEKIQFKLGFKTFDFNKNERFNYSQRFIKTDPAVELHFRTDSKMRIFKILRYRAIFLNEQYPDFNIGEYNGLRNEKSLVHRLEYSIENDDAISPFGLFIHAEQQSYNGFSNERDHYLKLTASYLQSFKFDKNKSIYFRLFGSGFISNTTRNTQSFANELVRGSIALSHQGFNDYLYDDFYFSRQNQGGKLANQVSLINGGGMKVPLGSAYSVGMSNNMAFSINVSSDLPINLPSIIAIKPYFDLGMYSISENDKMTMKTIWNGGLMFNYENIISIHFPLVYDQSIKNLVLSEQMKFINRISFSLNLDKLSPWNETERKF